MSIFAKTPGHRLHSASASTEHPGNIARRLAQASRSPCCVHHESTGHAPSALPSQHSFSRIAVQGRAPLFMQRKLAVSAPGDTYEQEADAIAERVLRMPDDQHEQPCACGGTCSTCQKQLPERLIQMRRVQSQDADVTMSPDSVHAALQTLGQPLETTTQAFFEPRFGHDFSHVRVHADATCRIPR